MNRILIIEDEKPLRDAFAFLLQSKGFNVELAENGKVGLAKLQTTQPDVVLLDVLMPVMNGLEFLEHASLAQKYPHVKTLLLSNLSDPITLEDVHTYGVTKMLLKADLSPDQLVAVINKMLANGDTKEGVQA